MDRVTVGRLRVDCAVPRDHPNPMAVRTRIDEAAERVPAALGELLEPLAKLGDEVIVIRKLELTFDLDTSLSPGDLARVWAARLAAAVAAALRPDARETMLRFSEEAHYLARFLVDSVAGRAAQSWYYRRWRGLDALSLAAQLRTAIIEVPYRGIAALAVLSPSELAAVLAALGPAEARRVIEAMIAEGPSTDVETAARVLTPLVPAWLPQAKASPSAWQAALALAAQAAAAHASIELPAIAALAAAVAATCRGELSATGAAPAAMLDGAGLPLPAPLLAVPAALRRELLAPIDHATNAEPATAPAVWYTRLGGLLLLLPRLEELPLDEVFGDGAGHARLVLLSRAAGHARRAEVLSSPLWRRLCGVGSDADIAAWTHAADTERRLRDLVTILWNRDAAHASARRLIVTRYREPLAVVASEPDGHWLSLMPLTPALRTVLRRTRSIELDGLALSAQITAATAQATARMLAWLQPDVTAPAGVAWTLAAQQVLRAFARRLPGFAESSPQFLYDSFLDFDATVLDGDDTFHCRVGRPRLAALFGLTGALRGRLRIGNGRALELYPG